MQKNPSAQGIPYDDFVKLLDFAFTFGAKDKEVTPTAKKHPLTRYKTNIDDLAKRWPDREGVEAIVCAYKAGAIALELASKTDHPDKVDEPEMAEACKKLEKLSDRYLSGKGPVCRQG